MLNDGGISGGPTTSTPVSLLVESLVQQLCTLLENDSSRSKQLYDSVCGKLEQMQLIDGTWNRGEFDVMRLQYQNALHQLVRVAKGPERLLPGSASTDDDGGVIWPLNQPVNLDWSRYHKDFDELSFIAGGGFGKVYRARNKLDGIVYAVKKVIIKAKSMDKVLSHLSEVKTLASLHHANIVIYKTAWLEPLMDDNLGDPLDLSGEGEDDDEDEEECSTNLIDKRLSTSSKNKKRSRRSKQITTKTREDYSDSLVVFAYSKDNTNNTGSEQQQLWTHHSSSSRMSCELTTDGDQMSTEEEEVEEETCSGIASNAVCHYENNKNKHRTKAPLKCTDLQPQPHLKLKWAVLYIQMSECQLTLRNWLDKRNVEASFTEFYRDFISTGLERNRSMGSMAGDVEMTLNAGNGNKEPCHLDVVSDIFLQLINGLYYIHSRNIIHHDIKPSNIFISTDHDSNILVQLGDFGLACPLQQGHENKIVGTPQYAAPEQLKGKCDKRSDLYSLGVILLELLLCFKTDMERNLTVKQAKRGEFPESVPTTFRDLISRLLSENVNDRPHSFELPELFSRLCRSHDPVVEDLQKKLSTQDEELARKNLEISELREKLAAMQTQEQKNRRQVQAKHHETRRLKKKLGQQRAASTSE